MSGYDYIQFLTEQFTSRLNASQQSSKPQHKGENPKEPTIYSPWFGVLPFAFKMMLTKQK